MSIPIPEKYFDTSTYSYYVQPIFYNELTRLNTIFAEVWPEPTVEDVIRVQSFLAREAHLIDNAAFNEWLELFTDQCLYWVPITAGGGNAATEVSHAFDDRRRLTDRVYWLRTGLAYSQLPASRTRRLITNVETIQDHVSGDTLVRSNFAIHEFRAGVTKLYTGWYAHVLTPTENGFQVRIKQANMLDSDQIHENLTLVF